MTTNPHIKAGGLPPTELHRVEPSMLPNATEFAGDEPDEDGPEEMLATVLILVLACLGLGSFIAGWLI